MSVAMPNKSRWSKGGKKQSIRDRKFGFTGEGRVRKENARRVANKLKGKSKTLKLIKGNVVSTKAWNKLQK